MKNAVAKFLIALSTLVIILMAVALLSLVYLTKMIVSLKYHNPFKRVSPLNEVRNG